MTEPKRYHGGLLDAHPAFVIEPLSEVLRAKVEAANWPEGLIDRVLALRRDRSEIEQWLDTGFPTPEMLESWISMQELLLNSTLNVREATWEYTSQLVDLCASAPETVGEWTVTVERGPYAQFRLQEHPSVTVVEDRRVASGWPLVRFATP